MSVRSWATRRSFRIALRTIVTTLLALILLVVTVPVLILRQWSKLYIKRFHKDSDHIGERLNPMAQIFLHDALTPNPRMNVIFCWFGQGTLSIESLREIFTKNILGSRVDDGKGSLILEYPELTSHVQNYGGYAYYTKIRNFDIQNYIKPYHGEPRENKIIRESDLKKIVAQLTAKGWPEGESPWEVLLINNYVDHDTCDAQEANTPNFKPKTVIIFRIHHLLADGYSMQRIIKLMSTGKFKSIADIKINEDVIMTWKKILFSPYLLPYNIALLMEECNHQPPTSWNIPLDKAGRNYYQEWSGGIPFEVLKRIKNAYGVTFKAVVSCIVGGAVKTLMEEMKKEVPQVMPAIFAWPRPGHPGGLVNHFGAAMIDLPVGDLDPVRRLKSLDAVLHKLSKSPLPSMGHLLYNWIGLFPSAVTQYGLKTDMGQSITLSPFPMFQGVSYIGSCRAIDTVYTGGPGWGSRGTVITTCSSYEKIRFAITIDQQVDFSEELLSFHECIQAEINALLKNM